MWSTIDDHYKKLKKNTDRQEFEKLFSNKRVVKRKKTKVKQDKKEIEKVKMVINERQHNKLAIMLTKFPSLDDTYQAIIKLDTNTLSIEHIERLESIGSMEEEFKLVREASLKPELMEKPARFLQMLDSIPGIMARLACWSFQLHFDEYYTDVTRPLILIEAACMALHKSTCLKKLLAVILYVGNFLNGGTLRGQADGYNLEIIDKLSRMKGSNKQSLLEYIAILCTKMFGSSFHSELHSELGAVGIAKSISLKDICSAGRKLKKKLISVKRMLSLVIAATTEENKRHHFSTSMDRSFDDWKVELGRLENQAKKTHIMYVNTVLWMYPVMQPRQAQSVPSEAFFERIDSIVLAVKIICTKYEAKKLRITKKNQKNK